MRVLLVILLVAACGPRQLPWVDPTLPEQEGLLTVRPPAEILHEAAAGVDPVLRGRAVHLLIRAEAAPAGGDWGARGLFDPHGWVQRQAVEALEPRLEQPEVQQALADFLERAEADPYARGRAGLLLAVHDPHRVRQAVDQALSQEREAWRRAPLLLVAARTGDEQALDELKRVLRSGQLPLDLAFLADVGASGLPSLAPALEQGAELAEEELHLALAAARLALGDTTAIPILRRALTDEDELVRLDALDLLSALPGEAAEALLRRAAQGDARSRGYAQAALAARGLEPPERLERAVQSEDAEVRRQAVRFAGQTEGSARLDRAARRVVLAGLHDPEPVVRLQALQSLHHLQVEEAWPAVEHLLRDPIPTVHIEAAGLLLAR